MQPVLEPLTEMVRGEGAWGAARQSAPGLASHPPHVRRMMKDMVTGQDRPVKLS